MFSQLIVVNCSWKTCKQHVANLGNCVLVFAWFVLNIFSLCRILTVVNQCFRLIFTYLWIMWWIFFLILICVIYVCILCFWIFFILIRVISVCIPSIWIFFFHFNLCYLCLYSLFFNFFSVLSLFVFSIIFWFSFTTYFVTAYSVFYSRHVSMLMFMNNIYTKLIPLIMGYLFRFFFVYYVLSSSYKLLNVFLFLFKLMSIVHDQRTMFEQL